MTSSNRKRESRTLKRVRPLLGTFVEITVRGEDETALNRGCSDAFDAVSEIDRLMSYHRTESDLSRVNRAAARRWVRVHPHTSGVLALSNALFTASGGAFDIRCGATLAGWGLLPAAPNGHSGPPGVTPTAPVEIDGDRVRKTGSWTLDLGGIAKGYAVDRAVDALRAGGIRSGVVNAGGDLRAFGPETWPVSLRHPARASLDVLPLRLKQAALATSGICFSRKRVGKRWVSALVRAGDGTPFLKRHSVSVLSDTCATADALTKVAALEPARAKAVLARFNASAFTLGINGAPRRLN